MSTRISKLLVVVLLASVSLVLAACSVEGESPSHNSTQATPVVQVHVELVSARNVIPANADPTDYVGGYYGGWGRPDQEGCRRFYNDLFKRTLAKYSNYHYRAGKQILEGPVTVHEFSTIDLCPD